MSAWVLLHSLSECVKNQRIVIAITDHIGHDSTVIQIKNGAQINFMDSVSFIPFKLCYVCHSFQIWRRGVEVTIQNVFGQILWTVGMACTTVVTILDGGTNLFDAADAQHTFVINMDMIVMIQVISYPAITFNGILHVDLFNLFCQLFIFYGTWAFLPRKPLIVGCARNMEIRTTKGDRISIFLVALVDAAILTLLSYLSKASLLSSSASFFNR